MEGLDETHDPARRSWVPGASEHPEFPVQNLPFGVFSVRGRQPRAGVAIGEFIVDLRGVSAAGLLSGEAEAAVEAAGGGSLSEMLELGAAPRRALRRRLSELLSDNAFSDRVGPLLHPAAECTLHLPCAIGDYTDFYAGIHHATNVGRQFRPEGPLLPNYKHIPIAYHGRSSSIRPSGMPVRRPLGQMKPPDNAPPVFAPCRRLDYELELGIWIGVGNELGEPIPIGQAEGHIAGYSLLNDWSARDIQAWEYRPLGPFLAKNFLTTVSCWIVTPEALAPFRIPQAQRPEGDPAPLAYLSDAEDQARGALDLHLEVLLRTGRMRAQGRLPHRVALSNARHMYWTVAQMVAHHASGGCNLRPGDLFGSGTISGPDEGSGGSMLESTLGGARPIVLPGGEERRFLDDGDEVFLRAYARRPGFASIGFGECRGVIEAARAVR